MKDIEKLCKYYDTHLFSGDLLYVRPRDEFRHLTKEIVDSEEPRHLVLEYYHWFSYFSYINNKFHFVYSTLEDKYKNALKTSVLQEDLGSSEKKREAKIINVKSSLRQQVSVAGQKYRESKSLLELSQHSMAVVSRLFTMSEVDRDTNRNL